MYRHADPSLALGWSCLRFCAPHTLCTTILLHTARPLNELLCQAPCTAGTSPRRAPVGQCATWCGPSLPQAREPPCPLFCHFLRVCACARGHGQQVCCQIGKVLWPCEATNWSRLSQCTVGVPINEVYKTTIICQIKVAGGYEKFVCLSIFKLWFFWRNL